MAGTEVIRTPDQRLRVFVSSTLQELATERRAVRDAVAGLRLVPVMFELGARPNPPRAVYRAYLAQSQVFVGVYWQSWGQVPPGTDISGLQDEYQLSAELPRLIYIKEPAPAREPRLEEMIARIADDGVSYKLFSDAAELRRLVETDLAVLLSERFEMAKRPGTAAGEAPSAGALPVPSTPLVGREEDVEAVTGLVLGEGARLVTLSGPGGVGKTRLAVEVARRLDAEFADGVRFVDLAPVSSPGLVLAEIAAGLGLSSSASRLLTDVRAYLRSRRLVLVLDNFEQLAAAAPLTAELLAAAPGLVVLVTSRIVLRISGEHEFPVPPLPVPAPSVKELADVARLASVRLFMERARAVDVSFELTEENDRAVAEICRRLDGLPLAIELAAARVKLLSPTALLDRLDDRMRLLTRGARDLPARQQTLRGTLDWSLDLLSPPERELFARLGVFSGTFGLEAVLDVSGCVPATQPERAQGLIDLLEALVDSSLVRPVSHCDEPRFWLLTIVREYALERLRADGDWEAVHDRHAEYFLALSESAVTELVGPHQGWWLDRLETEHDNLTAAITWLLDRDRVEAAVRLFRNTWRLWLLHAHVEEIAAMEERILAGSQQLPPYQRAMALSGIGFIALATENRSRARELFEQVAPLHRQVDGKFPIALAATAHCVLGRLAAQRGDDGLAVELFRKSRALLGRVAEADLTDKERGELLITTVLVDNFYGQVLLGRGANDSATRLFKEGLGVGRRASDRVSVLVSLYDLALSSRARGAGSEAAGFLREGLVLACDAGDEPSVAYYLECLADLAGHDDPEGAVCLLAAADSLLVAKGAGWLHAYVSRQDHGDHALAALRAMTGDAAFEKSWARGLTMDARRAVDFAVGLTPELTQAPGPDVADRAGR